MLCGLFQYNFTGNSLIFLSFFFYVLIQFGLIFVMVDIRITISFFRRRITLIGCNMRHVQLKHVRFAECKQPLVRKVPITDNVTCDTVCRMRLTPRSIISGRGA